MLPSEFCSAPTAGTRSRSSRAGSEAKFCHVYGFYVWGEEPVLLTCLMSHGQLHFLETLTPVTASPDSGFTGGADDSTACCGEGTQARLGHLSFCAIPVISSEGGRGSFLIRDVTCELMGPEVQSHSAVLHPCVLLATRVMACCCGCPVSLGTALCTLLRG